MGGSCEALPPMGCITSHMECFVNLLGQVEAFTFLFNEITNGIADASKVFMYSSSRIDFWVQCCFSYKVRCVLCAGRGGEQWCRVM